MKKKIENLIIGKKCVFQIYIRKLIIQNINIIKLSKSLIKRYQKL